MYRDSRIVIGLFIFVVLSAYGADKTLDFEENPDRAPYWQSQGRASDHFSRLSLDADLPTSMVFSLNERALISTLNRSLGQDISGGKVYFPNTEGKMLQFDVRETSNFSPGLAAKYPNIKAYRGYSLDHPQLRLYFSYSPSGLKVTFVDVGTRVKTTIKKISQKNDSYIAYTQLDDSKPKQTLSCSTPEPPKISLKSAGNSAAMIDLAGKMSPLARFSDESTLTTYRLAVATNGQYTAYHGGTVDSALAAINTTLTALNFIFETDIGIRLQLIDDNDLIVYTDPDTDPFQDDANNLDGTMNSELQDTLDSVIGSENYDVGHIFSGIGGGGNAGAIGAFCNDSSKGSAWSASTQPEGSYFINLVAHEMGHQLGANHTFSNRTEGTGTNVEPGSGTTIMSYAGITGPDDVALNGDDYYHNVSILQGLSYLKSQSCHVNKDIANNIPTVKALSNYTIPVGTPFVLTGSATDVDESDALTYTWEQVDDGLVPSSVFGPENTQGANFRSLPPSENPTRYFPLLTSVIAGDLTQSSPNIESTWETLSTVPREFNFAFTARDNATGGSGVASTRTKITVVDRDGAFLVTSQSDGQLYLSGSEQTVTWSVAGTNTAPILSESVNITLSIDGGLTFPYSLAENVANDGSHAIQLPDAVTSEARVRVNSVNNIFYAINSRDFGITRDDIVLTFSELSYPICNNESVSASLIYETSSSFTDTAIFSSLNAPSGLIVEFSPLSASMNNTVVDVTFSATNDIEPNTYPVEVVATSDIRSQSVIFNFSAYSSAFSPVVLVLPMDQSLLSGLRAKLEWQKQNNAVSYKVEVATDESFGEIFFSSTVDTNFTTITGLQRETNYYWRVRPMNSCGVSDAGTSFSFTTPNLFQAQNLPVAITSDAPTSVSSTISISENLVITDINVGVDISHTYVPELIATLTSPNGVSITLMQDACYVEEAYPIQDINTVFDDDGSDLICGSLSPVVSGTIRPQLGTLDIINNQSTQGDWILSIEDIYAGDGGSLDNFTLEISTDGPYVNRAPIALPQVVKATAQGSTLISLGATDPERQQLTFSLVDAPMRGQLSVVAPILLDQSSTSGGAQKVAINGDYAYLAAYTSGLAIVDISDPSNIGMPVYMATTGEALGVAVRGNYAYVADGASGLHIVDVSDPSSPSLVSTFDTGGYAFDVTLSADGNKAYVSDGSSGLHIVDVSNPVIPSSWGILDTGGEALGMVLSENGIKAYIANGQSGLAIANVSDAANLYVYGSLTNLQPVESVALSLDGRTAYLASGFNGLLVVDVSYSFEPILTDILSTEGYASDLVLSSDGSKAYVANGAGGLKIIGTQSASISALGDFRVSADLQTDTLNVVLSPDGTKAYLSDRLNGLQIVDVVPIIFSAEDTIPQNVTYTHTTQDVISNAPTDVFAFKVNDGEFDSNLANVDLWMDSSISNTASLTFVRTSDDQVTLTGCVSACEPNLVIPETIGFFSSPVVAIGEGAFADSGIISLTIPDSVTTIGDYAFTLNFLRSLTIADSVTEIGEDAFAYNNLLAVSFLGDRPSLAVGSFYGNRDLTFVSYCDDKSGWPGGSISVGSSDVTPREGCDSINLSADALNQLLTAADSGNASEVTIDNLNSIIGLVNVNADNLNAYQTAISLLTSGTSIDQINELQSLINSVNTGILSCPSTPYFVNVTSGSYPEEVSWLLEDDSGAVLYEGIAPFSGMICIGDARYILQMFDAYGDGWNGAEFSVLTISGDRVLTQALNSGSQGEGAVNVGDYPNEAPSANSQAVTLVEKILTDITLSGTDPENDQLTYYLASEPTKGNFRVAFNPSLLGSVANNTFGIDVVVSSDGTRAYIANYDAGLQIVDVSDASNPVAMSTFDTSGFAFNVAVSTDGNTVYIADEEIGLQVVDVADSSNPLLLSTFNTAGASIGVTLSSDDRTVFIANADPDDDNDGVDFNSLEIVDISDAQSPSLLASVPTSGAAYEVGLSPDGNTAYVAVDAAGLDIIDISNPAYPVLVSNLDTPGGARAVKLSSDGYTAYVTDDTAGLQIVDVTDLANPVILSNFDTEGNSWGLALSSDDSFAFIADLNSLQVIDVSDRAEPKSKGSFSTSGSRGVALSADDNTAYIAQDNALLIIDASLSSIQVGDRIPAVVTYVSTEAEATADSFSFKVNDGRLNSAAAAVDITILLDTDGDGVINEFDAFPLDPAETIDTDSDGIGNNADTDDDGDGVIDEDDALPLDPTNDSDSDGISNNLDAFPLDASEAADADSDGVGDNSDVYPNNNLYALDSDSDGMPNAWELRYGLDPNDPSDASSDVDNDGVAALDEFLAGTAPSGSIDIDGNGQYDALTDGILILRGMFGLAGDALVAGAISSDAIYIESEDIESQIDTLGELLDIDGNGRVDALTDGLLILRYLFGLNGDSLIEGVIAADATRTSAADIEAYFDDLMPVL